LKKREDIIIKLPRNYQCGSLVYTHTSKMQSEKFVRFNHRQIRSS